MTQPPLAPLGEESIPGRDGSWKEGVLCRHLQTAEDAGIAGNDLELPAGDVELDDTPEGVQRA